MKTNKLILTIVFGIILLAGVVTANNLNDLSTTMNLSSSSIYGGESVLANFTFNYFELPGNYNSSALIIKLNLTSDNQSNFPVWKNDFKINGYTDKCTYTILGMCVLPKKIYFSCSELNQTTINSTEYGLNVLNVPNGTFYCYNESNDLSLNEGDNIFLNITPNFAIWPSNYTINASLFYLNDTLAPFVNITNKSYFNQYFKAGNYVDFKANIYDMVGLSDYHAKIIVPFSQNISFSKEKVLGNIYHFYQTLPNKEDLPGGNYTLIVTATDTSGNAANDSVILKIDNTGPIIKVLQPTNNSVVSDMLPIELNVTDAKSGVNENSVYYELAAVVNGVPCPDTGIGINATCPNTHWINLPYNTTTKTFFKSVNVTNLSSGSYWLYAKAKDTLGNKGVL